MLFTTYPFLLFFPVVLWMYWKLPPHRISFRNAWLLMASYFFYGFAHWPWLGILGLSTLFNFVWGRQLPKASHKKLSLGVGVSGNLALLGLCKYGGTWFSSWQLENTWIVPLGVSFFTFHGISYLVDIYRTHIQPETNIIHFGLFMAFFPLLVAGPIERAFHLLPQIRERKSIDFARWRVGLHLMIWGFIKKMGIADGLAETADLMFGQYHQFHGYSLLLGLVAFSFQIYADFSGYSDIARGLAHFFGFNLLLNFRFPYRSASISEFWKRWHISLSSWFRDYVYIPLGGSRHSAWQTQRNIAVVFILSGIWHGTTLNFAVWGLMHGLGYAIYQVYSHVSNLNLPRWLAIFLTWLFVTLGWLFFRAESLGHATAYWHHMWQTIWANPGQWDGSGKSILFFLFPLFVMEWFQKNRADEINFPTHRGARWLLYGATGLWIVGTIVSNSQAPTFIYFNF